MMKKIGIIIIGDEHLYGDILDTNSNYLAKKILFYGQRLNKKWVVGDNEKDMINCFKETKDFDYIFTIAGLGPTHDDITKETIAKWANLELDFNDKIWSDIKKKLSHLENVSDLNKKQAFTPKGSTFLENKNGTAPGLSILIKKTHFFLLPGPPKEFCPLIDRILSLYFDKAPSIQKVDRYILGEVEATVGERLKTLQNESLPVNLGIYSMPRCLRISLNSRKTLPTEIFNGFIATLDKSIEKMTVINQHPVEWLRSYLEKNSKTIATAESLSGGKISALLASKSGSSSYFLGSICSYSNEIKQNILNVDPIILQENGAVSSKCAHQMVQGLAKMMKCDFGISVTGIAGPTGATLDKPIGLVYIGLYLEGDVKIEKIRLKGDRQSIIKQTTQYALIELVKKIQKKLKFLS